MFRGARDRPIVEIRRALAQVNDAVPFKFHDLRRTAASHLGAIGCPTETIKAILNHDLEMGITGIYVHVDLCPGCGNGSTAYRRTTTA